MRPTLKIGNYVTEITRTISHARPTQDLTQPLVEEGSILFLDLCCGYVDIIDTWRLESSTSIERSATAWEKRAQSPRGSCNPD